MYLMFLFLQMKQYIIERKIFNELSEKVKKSEVFEYFDDNDPNYICKLKLDTIEIRFQRFKDLEVFDKTGKQIFVLNGNCVLRSWDKVAPMRVIYFDSLLDMAKKRKENKNQVKETKKAVKTRFRYPSFEEKQKQEIALAKKGLYRIRGA